MGKGRVLSIRALHRTPEITDSQKHPFKKAQFSHSDLYNPSFTFHDSLFSPR